MNELEDWWHSPAAAAIRTEARPTQEFAGDSVDVVIQASSPEKPETADAASHASLWRRRWIGTLALGVGLTLTVLAGCYASGFRWSSVSDGTLVGRNREGAHGEALSAQRIRLALTIDGKVSSVVVAEGEMARIETDRSRYGVQARVTDGSLKVFLFRLGKAGSRESATFVESRNLAARSVERLPLDGLSVQLSWQLVDDPANAGHQPPKEPCCMVCNGVAVCGELVGGDCGNCDANTRSRQ